jgi:hypothetical protein
MFLKKMGWRPLLWVCVLLVAAGALAAGTGTAPAPVPTPAPAPARATKSQHDWKNVTVLYLSDIKGKIEPCG